MRTREATLPDAEQIHALITNYSGDGTLLPRTLAEICENVRDFVVLEDEGESSDAARFICMACTWRKSVRSPSIPRAKAAAAAGDW